MSFTYAMSVLRFLLRFTHYLVFFFVQKSELLTNPICGLMIGVMATVMVQSSSTSTSIVVAMTASGIIPITNGIPIIMGANVGTSLTNTLVSLGSG